MNNTNFIQNNQKRPNLIALRKNMNFINKTYNNENIKSLTPIPKKKIIRKFDDNSNNIIYLSNFKSINMKKNNNNNFKTNLTNYKTTNNVNNTYKYKTHNQVQSNFVYNDNFNNYNNNNDNNNNNYKHLSMTSSYISNKNNIKSIREKRRQNANLFNTYNNNHNISVDNISNSNYSINSNNNNKFNYQNNKQPKKKPYNDDYNKQLISNYINKKRNATPDYFFNSKKSNISIKNENNNNNNKTSKINNNRNKTPSSSSTNSSSFIIDPNNSHHKIHLIKGICRNCINLEICRLHHQKKPPSNLGEDPFSIQSRRNRENLERIQKKIKKNYDLSLQAINKFNPNSQEQKKNKLIEENINSKNIIYNNYNNYNPLKEKVLRNYYKNQEHFKNQRSTIYSKNIEDFYKKPNPITNYSVNAIGKNAFVNKYIPTKNELKIGLEKQLGIKEKEAAIQKKIDQENERKIYEKNLKDIQKEQYEKENYYNKLKNDFIKGNNLIINEKKKREILNKSSDVALEKENERKNKEFLYNEQLKKIKKDYEMKKELKNGLEMQIKNNERNRNLEKKDNIYFYNNENGNVFLEPEIIDEYGKCLKCVKIYKANQIFPKKEYDNIRENSLYQNYNNDVIY